MHTFRLELSPRWRLTPPQVLVTGFAAVILTGTFLLTLPVASVSHKPTAFIDALFTATSAVCVTGLVVVDTGTYWSRFGHIVLLGLIQIGGLGFMTLSTLASILFGRRIMLHQRLVIQEALNCVSLEGVVRLTKAILKFTVIVEAVGASFLSWRWWQQYSPGEAFFQGVFHSVSAFCNAGFDIKGDFLSLTTYRGDIVVNLVITSLIILGGLGFAVIVELLNWPHADKVSLHTHLVIKTTLLLTMLGMVFILIVESNNPATLALAPWKERLLASYFQAVTPCTAGFNTLPLESLRPATLFFLTLLMFVGASPGGTGGGIKTTTFVILIMSITNTIQGKSRIEIRERSIPSRLVLKSMAITLLSAFLVVTITLILLLSDGADFLTTLFETISAFGTVGLSIAFTPKLSVLGRFIIASLMFTGRVGPLTLAVAIAQRQKQNHINYPEESIVVG